MPTYFRIVQSHWSASAMDGEGARIHGGRWNPPGVPAVYLAVSRALAALEVWVHAPREVMRADWQVVRVGIEEEWIERLGVESLPTGWRGHPTSDEARALGGEWLRRGKGLALRLPSVVVPQESILLINPRHSLARLLDVSIGESFEFGSGWAGK